jgi:hypothetical protein
VSDCAIDLGVLVHAIATSQHKDMRRLRNPTTEYRQELFPFLNDLLIEPTNNRAERQWWSTVIMMKLTFGKRSVFGASNQAITISISDTGP